MQSAMTVATPIIKDDDGWIDLERARPGGALPVVACRVSKRRADKAARAFLVFRGEAAAWIEASATRYRVQIGGRSANKVRLIPDDKGRYEAANMRGSKVIRTGIVTAWPDEFREITEADWAILQGCMVLTLPEDWAVPTKPRAAQQPMPPPAAATKPQPFPVTTSAPGTQRIAIARANEQPIVDLPQVKKIPPGARITDHRQFGSVNLGEPPPGRSALDKRRAGQ